MSINEYKLIDMKTLYTVRFRVSRIGQWVSVEWQSRGMDKRLILETDENMIRLAGRMNTDADVWTAVRLVDKIERDGYKVDID